MDHTFPSRQTIFSLALFALLAGRPAAAEDPPAAGGVLTLDGALRLVLQHNPDLAASAWESRVAEAEAVQAGLVPNPELEAEFEDFGGSGELAGTDASELTLQLGQRIELGGKRARRVAVAGLAQRTAAWEYETRRLDTLAAVTQAFVDVLAGQERVALARDLVELATRALDTAQERVRAGKVSALDETRAQVELASSQIALDRPQRDLDASRKRLAAAWGALEPDFERVAGAFYRLPDPPPLAALIARVTDNPDVARWETETGLRDAALRLAQANAVPDLEVRGGVRYANESDDAGFLVGLALPLPLFDRNQGAIQAAVRRREQVEDARRAAQVRAQSELAATYESLVKAHRQVRTLERDVQPAAEEVFEGIEEAYRLGKLGYLDVLDARRTLFETQAAHIDAAAEYHEAVAVIERLVAGPLEGRAAAAPTQDMENDHD